MTAINFMPQFVPAIQNGNKRQTIRKTRKYPIKVGDTLQLYTKLRTKYAELIMEAICSEVCCVVIETTRVLVDGKPIADLDKFAIADGFKNWQEMRAWFEKTHSLPFQGDLIRWEEAISWVKNPIEPEDKIRGYFSKDNADEIYKGWSIFLDAPNGGILGVTIRNKNSAWYWCGWTEHDDHYDEPDYHLAIARKEIDQREAKRKPYHNKNQLEFSF